MSKAISIQVPESVLSYWESERQLEQELSYLSVLELVREKKITSGKASELLDISRWEMAELLSQHDVPSSNFSVQ
ncbi:MAG: UPF0175 family protein [Ignavibacteria bacterium]|nr:UPF0175 family protein [Ignavibacteria bacterium]